MIMMDLMSVLFGISAPILTPRLAQNFRGYSDGVPGRKRVLGPFVMAVVAAQKGQLCRGQDQSGYSLQIPEYGLAIAA